MLAVALGARTIAEMRAALAQAARVADVAELRLDYLQEPCRLPSLLHARPCPVIVTNRPLREGGLYRGDESARVEALREACALGAEHVDVEWDSAEGFLRGLARDRTKVIISRHDFHAVPANLEEVHQRLRAQGADIVKVAGMPRGLGDALDMLECLAQAEAPTIAIAMGEHGLVSRVLALRYPACYLTFAALDDAQAVAPGQIAAAAMREIFQADRIGPATIVYGALGPHGGDRAEWQRMTLALRETGLDAVYVPLKLGPGDDLRACLNRLLRLGLRGVRVEAPIQIEAAQVAGRLEAPARRRGRVDTLYWDGERWIGSWTGREGPLRAWVR